MFVVAGSTGNTGSVVAETLLAQGKKVRALGRDADKLAKLAARGAETVSVSLGDERALTEALRGAEGAYLLVPPDLVSNQVLVDQAKVTASIAAAVRSARVPHVVFLSSVAAHLPAGTGPIRTLHATERALSEVTDHVTFIRAGYFMENLAGSLGALAQGVLPTFFRPDLAVEMVATKDIGALAAEQLLAGPRGRQVLELDGPRAYSAEDVAAELAALTGKAVQAHAAPESEVVPTFTGFGLTTDMAGLYEEMIHGINTGHVRKEGGAARHVRGKTALREVLARLVAR